MKAVAASIELGRWYRHQADLLPETRHRYQEELQRPLERDALEQVASAPQEGEATLVTATHELPLSAATEPADELALRTAAGPKLQTQSGPKSAPAYEEETL